MNWEIGIDIYTLICIKWITNKNLLYKKINKIPKKKEIGWCRCDAGMTMMGTVISSEQMAAIKIGR